METEAQNTNKPRATQYVSEKGPTAMIEVFPMTPMATGFQLSGNGFLDFHPTIQGNQGLELGPQERWILHLSIAPTP